jgi:uncharacterized protein (TIGR04255 family)
MRQLPGIARCVVACSWGGHQPTRLAGRTSSATASRAGVGRSGRLEDLPLEPLGGRNILSQAFSARYQAIPRLTDVPDPNSQPLPEFEAPPVAELALSVQFHKLPKLRAPVLAEWKELRERFPIWEEQRPWPTQSEVFGLRAPQMEIGIDFDVPSPRAFFYNAARTEAVQIQQNALVRNWRRGSDSDSYPRYETIKAGFREDFERLQRFVAEHQLGEVVPIQCEVTYVNHVPISDLSVAEILPGCTGRQSDGYLPPAEGMQSGTRYVMTDDGGRPLGRLHVIAQEGMGAEGRALQLSLVARGAPQGKDSQAVVDWLDLGHEWAVRGFASVTGEAAHRFWKRKR